MLEGNWAEEGGMWAVKGERSGEALEDDSGPRKLTPPTSCVQRQRRGLQEAGRLSFSTSIKSVLRSGYRRRKGESSELGDALTHLSGPRQDRDSFLSLGWRGCASLHVVFNLPKHLHCFSWEELLGKITQVAFRIPEVLTKLKFLKLECLTS